MNPLTPKHYIKAHKLGVVSLSTDAAGTKAISSSIEGTVYLSDLTRGKAVAKKATYKEQTEEGTGEYPVLLPYVPANQSALQSPSSVGSSHAPRRSILGVHRSISESRILYRLEGRRRLGGC